MRSEGTGRQHVAGRDHDVPLPKKSRPIAARERLIECCGMRIRPGAFHIHVDLTTPEPVVKPKVEKPKPKRRAKRRRPAGARHCACGKPVDPRTKKCRECRTADKPECGTVEGYNWHRRQALKNPGSNPWPLPKADPCGCRAALAQASKARRAAA